MKFNKPLFIACKEAPERLPPVLSLIKVAVDLFPKVIILTTVTSKDSLHYMNSLGAAVIQSLPDSAIVKKDKSKLSKLKEWVAFRKMFWENYHGVEKDCVLWIATADSALAIGRRLQKLKYILGLLELYDDNKMYLYLLRKYIKSAKHVVTPDECRSAIFRVWYELAYTPTVIPNKPVGIQQEKYSSVTNEDARSVLERAAGKKLLLYQARMVRMEVFDIVEAIQKYLGSEYVLGILGDVRDAAMFGRLKEVYPELIHIPYVAPPHHLEISSHAHIGLLIYNYESLNNVFCAPNKIWEFAAVRVPMITHQLPMLSEKLRHFRAGETFEAGNPRSIADAIIKIDSDYLRYSQGSRELYDSSNIKELVSAVCDNYER